MRARGTYDLNGRLLGFKNNCAFLHVRACRIRPQGSSVCSKHAQSIALALIVVVNFAIHVPLLKMITHSNIQPQHERPFVQQ